MHHSDGKLVQTSRFVIAVALCIHTHIINTVPTSHQFKNIHTLRISSIAKIISTVQKKSNMAARRSSFMTSSSPVMTSHVIFRDLSWVDDVTSGSCWCGIWLRETVFSWSVFVSQQWIGVWEVILYHIWDIISKVWDLGTPISLQLILGLHVPHSDVTGNGKGEVLCRVY